MEILNNTFHSHPGKYYFRGDEMNGLRLAILAVFIFTASATFAQTSIPGPLTVEVPVTATDSFLVRLPKLETFIDSALARAPALKNHDLNVQRDRLLINRTKMNWAKDIVTGGISVSYGLFDNLIISKDLGVDQLNTKANEQTRYTLGLALKLPISTLYDRFDLKMAKITLEQTENEKTALIQTIREEVYNRYSYMVTAYQNYAMLLEDIDAYDILLNNAEKDFLSNRITVEEYTSVKMSISRARMDLNNARNDLMKALWSLEELTGIKIR